MTVKISILMPVYNVEHYIDEALSSLILQDFTEWEAVIVDDGSNDKTKSIVASYAKKDHRIILLENLKNCGLVYSLNKGLKICKGEFIARFDGDDIMLPCKLQNQFDYLKKNPKIQLVGSDVITINQYGEEVGEKSFLRTPKLIKSSISYFNPMLHCWLARKEIYTKLNGYRNIHGAEDYDFLMRGTFMGYQYSSIPKKLIKIRKRYGNTVSSAPFEQSLSVVYLHQMAKAKSITEPNTWKPTLSQTETARRYSLAIMIVGNRFITGKKLNIDDLLTIIRSGMFLKMYFWRFVYLRLASLEGLIVNH